jgi:hypothetical protein
VTTATPTGTATLQTAEAYTFNTGTDGKPYTLDTVLPLGSATGSYNLATVAGANLVTFNNLTTANGDYSITAPTQAATITAKPLTVTGLSVPSSKVYDGTTTTATPSGTATLLTAEAKVFGTGGDGAPYTGDTVSLSGSVTSAYDHKDVATATTVTFSGLSTLNGNYSITAPTEAATITPKALTIVANLAFAASKAYDGTTTATPSAGTAALQGTEVPPAGTTSDGKPYSVDAVSLNHTASYNYNTKDVATATTITESGLTLTGTGNGNYTITPPTFSATITPKALTVTGLSVPASKVYDGTLTTATPSGTAALLTAEAASFFGTGGDGKPYIGDTVLPLGTATGAYDHKDVATATTVTFSGLSTANGDYTITAPTQGATITAKPLTVTGLSVPASKVYDGTTSTAMPSGTATLQTAEAYTFNTGGDGKPYTGDSVSLSGTASGAYDHKDVATATTVTLSGLSTANGDYTISAPTQAATITAKPLTVTGLSVPASKVYDGTTTTATPTGTATLLTAEAYTFNTGGDGKPYIGDTVLPLGTATGAYDHKDVATATTVTFSGLSTANGNYSITVPTQASTTITPKQLTIIGLIANNKTADGHATATLSGAPTLLTPEAYTFNTGGDGKPYTGDTVSLTGTATGTFATSAAGTGIAVSVGGLSLTGPQLSDYSLSALTLSADITAGPTDHYLVSFFGPSYQGIPFTTTVTAQDLYNNTVTTDSTTVVTNTSSSLNLMWEDPTEPGVYNNGLAPGEAVHATRTLSSGVASFQTQDLVLETGVTTTATDATGKTGTSAPIDIGIQAGTYRSITSGNWADLGTWEVYDGTSWVAAIVAPSVASGLIIIQPPNTVTVGAGVTVDQVYVQSGGQITVSSGATLTNGNASLPGLEIYGTVDVAAGGTLTTTAGTTAVYGAGVLENAGTINSSAATLIFEALNLGGGTIGGTYQHLFTTTAGTIPTATWEADTVCEIAGYTSNTTPPGGLNQNFQNFIWDCPGQSGTINLGGNPTAVGGDFTVSSTGSGALTLGGDLAVTGTATVSSGATLNCATYTLSGGAFTVAAGGNLGLGSPDGITSSGASGNIQTTTRNFGPGANYTYNGTGAQVTGNGLPGTVNNLTINNSAGVTLTAAETVSGTVALGSSGKLDIGTTSQNSTANVLTIAGVSEPAGTWGSMGSTATYQNNAVFDSAGAGILTVHTGGGYRIMATTAVPAAGVGDQLTINLVDGAGSTMTSFNGTKTLTFHGLATADDGTRPTVTGNTGSAVSLGTAELMTFVNGVSSSAGGAAVLKAYKAEGPVTLDVVDSDGVSSTSPGGAGVSLTIANVAPVAIPHSFTRAPSLSYKIALTDLLAGASDVNHDTLSVSGVDAHSVGGANLSMNSTYVFYTPNSAGTGDTFAYQISDGHGGTASSTVTVNVAAQSGGLASITVTGSTVSVTLFGIPGIPYDVQRSLDFSSWTTLSTSVTPTPPITPAGDGRIIFTDDFSDLGSPPPAAFYRTVPH